MMGYSMLLLLLHASLINPLQMKAAMDDQETPQERNIEREVRSGLIPSYRTLSNPYPAGKKPLAPGGWFVEIGVSGGLNGSDNKEYILITSEGDITVDSLEGYRNLKLLEVVAKMEQLIKRAQPSQWSATGKSEQIVSLCQECYKTTLTLYRRQGVEIQSGYQAYWDETTASRVIAEVTEITKEAEKIKERALRP